jgi:hypothetical protein
MTPSRARELATRLDDVEALFAWRKEAAAALRDLAERTETLEGLLREATEDCRDHDLHARITAALSPTPPVSPEAIDG